VNRKVCAIALLAAGALALTVAGCGGGSSSSSSSAARTEAPRSGTAGNDAETVKAAPNAEKGTTFVSLASVAGLGMVLVDSEGITLYDFKKDQGTESACYGDCAKAWPPLLAKGEPQPSNGADASQLGTTERKDGTMQVTYAGHPLYGFIGDKAPGEASGNNVDAFGGEWYALNSAGEEPAGGGGEGPTSSGEGTTSSGGGAYGY
jgi:predicted lipoprotein with Yx(FWY)xxD motif